MNKKKVFQIVGGILVILFGLTGLPFEPILALFVILAGAVLLFLGFKKNKIQNQSFSEVNPALKWSERFPTHQNSQPDYNKIQTKSNTPLNTNPIDQDRKEKKYNITVPKRKENCPIAYTYSKVPILDLNYDLAMDMANRNLWEFDVLKNENSISLMFNNAQIGIISDHKKFSMLSDWIKNNEPYLVYLETINSDTHQATAFLAFYRDKRAKLDYREQTTVKLTSYASEEKQTQILCLDDGDELKFDEDDDNVYILSDFDQIGKLPKKAANRYLDEGAYACFLDHVDYDDYNDKYVPFVTIYW